MSGSVCGREKPATIGQWRADARSRRRPRRSVSACSSAKTHSLSLESVHRLSRARRVRLRSRALPDPRGDGTAARASSSRRRSASSATLIWRRSTSKPPPSSSDEALAGESIYGETTRKDDARCSSSLAGNYSRPGSIEEEDSQFGECQPCVRESTPQTQGAGRSTLHGLADKPTTRLSWRHDAADNTPSGGATWRTHHPCRLRRREPDHDRAGQPQRRV